MYYFTRLSSRSSSGFFLQLEGTYVFFSWGEHLVTSQTVRKYFFIYQFFFYILCISVVGQSLYERNIIKKPKYLPVKFEETGFCFVAVFRAVLLGTSVSKTSRVNSGECTLVARDQIPREGREGGIWGCSHRAPLYFDLHVV